MSNAPAVIALIGVIVGSAISMGTNFILAIRKEKGEEALRQNERNLEFQKAVRIVDAELMTSESVLETLIKNKTWPARDFDITIPAWAAYREVLARIPSDTAWSDLVRASFFTSTFNDVMIEHRDDRGQPVDNDNLKRAESLLEAVSQARKHLSSLRRALN